MLGGRMDGPVPETPVGTEYADEEKEEQQGEENTAHANQGYRADFTTLKHLKCSVHVADPVV